MCKFVAFCLSFLAALKASLAQILGALSMMNSSFLPSKSSRLIFRSKSFKAYKFAVMICALWLKFWAFWANSLSFSRAFRVCSSFSMRLFKPEILAVLRVFSLAWFVFSKAF